MGYDTLLQGIIPRWIAPITLKALNGGEKLVLPQQMCYTHSNIDARLDAHELRRL